MTTYDDRSILVIDPDKVSKEQTCDLLETLGFNRDRIWCATNSNEVQDWLNEEFDLIFAQITNRDSYSVCTLIREHNKNTPIFLTAFVHDLLGPFRAMAARAQGFLLKPLDPEAVKAQVDKCLKILDMDKKIQELVNSTIDYPSEIQKDDEC